jgi:hypothetical protein
VFTFRHPLWPLAGAPDWPQSIARLLRPTDRPLQPRRPTYQRSLCQPFEICRGTDLQAALNVPPLASRVARLRCFRGINDLTALTIAVELGDATRFPAARQVMGFTGVVRSEYSSGATQKHGAITKPAMRTSVGVGRRGVALSPSPGDQSSGEPPPARGARRGHSLCRERAASPACALSAVAGARQIAPGRRHGRGP